MDFIKATRGNFIYCCTMPAAAALESNCFVHVFCVFNLISMAHRSQLWQQQKVFFFCASPSTSSVKLFQFVSIDLMIFDLQRIVFCIIKHFCRFIESRKSKRYNKKKKRREINWCQLADVNEFAVKCDMEQTYVWLLRSHSRENH